MLKEFSLGFGDSQIKVALPEEKIINVVEGKPVAPITDVPAAVREALNNPIGTPPLKEVVKAGDKVAIIASDITRMWVKHDQFLPVLLDELNAAGVPDRDIKLVVGLGAHRRHTDKENVRVYGQQVVDRIEIVQSYAPAEEDFVYVGKTSRGVETYLNKHVVNADKVILTGGIVYHLMAGFGGGRKAIMPGVSGYATIQGNHSYCLHDEVGKGISPHCVSGKLEGNNMHEDMTEMAAMLNPAFLLNAVFTPEGQFARFVAGHWYDAWREGCRTVEEIFGVPVKGKADLVIASAGGFPKDINLYQGSKTIDNAFMAVKEDGVIILLLECRDIMEPPDFSGWFNYESLYDREVALRKGFTVPGFIALKCGLMAAKVPHIVVTLPENKAFVEKAGMIAVTTIEEAMALAEQKLGRKDYTITVMPHAANTVPLVQE
ncbi:nickel-dependent lactate racemase [Sporolituus thermophilus]|uniref:Nickel-dependent lactate racemase n=1 Tax=Sporolituus thermophilus DSM 23256 TaxID=1123285 RepID=A0A1G7J2V9_9FIRM|nr:nickel-dependent lactate racemase [Sporolituus thermophilus]SDF19221.1 Nickel-dependent lactate racemase [Sporolituus thermophilus DSM 23256]